MKISVDVYECALEHVISKGDTDIFPYPFEIKFLEQMKSRIAEELSKTELNTYHPMSLLEALVPKSKFGFRVAHQPFPIDTVIYTALVLEVFDSVEAGRDPAGNERAFSYRKSLGLDPDLFVPDRKYRDWLDSIRNKVFETQYTHVIRTDISDYYSRIYRHRLENILESLSGNSKLVKKIEHFIADWRGNQSFGLPVGSGASRLLAEAALNDTDMGLISEGYEHTRYVDDMMIFIKGGQDPYAALGYLAKHLTENEGLALNNQKTYIQTWDEFVSSAGEEAADDETDSEDLATERLFLAAYGNEEVDEEALAALMLRDLSKELENLLDEAYWDMGQIRIVLHAMRLVKSTDVADYIRKNLSTLVPFAKDVCLLIHEFIRDDIKGFEGIDAELVELLLSPRMLPLECARAWFLELIVRDLVKLDSAQIKRLDSLTGPLDVRQLHLIRWRFGDLNYFRSRKTKIQEIQPWAQPSFIFGARCLPKDEYSHWIRGIKSRLQFPLSKEFADWCVSTYDVDPIS